MSADSNLADLPYGVLIGRVTNATLLPFANDLQKDKKGDSLSTKDFGSAEISLLKVLITLRAYDDCQ